MIGKYFIRQITFFKVVGCERLNSIRVPFPLNATLRAFSLLLGIQCMRMNVCHPNTITTTNLCFPFFFMFSSPEISMFIWNVVHRHNDITKAEDIDVLPSYKRVSGIPEKESSTPEVLTTE